MFSDVFVLFGKVVRGRRVQCSVTWDWRRRPHPPPASAFTHTTLPSLPGAAQTPVCSMFNLLLLLFLHTHNTPLSARGRANTCLFNVQSSSSSFPSHYKTILDSKTNDVVSTSSWWQCLFYHLWFIWALLNPFLFNKNKESGLFLVSASCH